MERAEIIATVNEMISQETHVPKEKLDLDASLTDLDIDSLDILKLAAGFERVFNIKISTAELMEIRTVGDIVVGIARKTSD
jgi:acyl carrier protein